MSHTKGYDKIQIISILVIIAGIFALASIDHSNKQQTIQTININTQNENTKQPTTNAGVANLLDSKNLSTLPSAYAGVAKLLAIQITAATNTKDIKPEENETDTDKNIEEENEYSNLAIANVDNYVNVRNAPNTDSEIVGKMYDGSVAQILSTAGENNEWFQVVSGNVEGYIKSEYFISGENAAAVIDDYVTRYIVVQADRLNVRKEPDITSSRIGYIDNGEKAKLIEWSDTWAKVNYANEKEGYVASEYVTITEEFIYAKSIEEEMAELYSRAKIISSFKLLFLHHF